MPKRSEMPAEREARERVKQRYDAQLAAINDFFARERRIEGLRSDMATLELEQGEAAAKLVDATSVAQAAEILGWSQAKAREAVGPRRRTAHTADDDGIVDTEGQSWWPIETDLSLSNMCS